MGWEMFLIQMLLVWIWFRRRVLCQRWSELSTRTQGRWEVTRQGAGVEVDCCFLIFKTDFWPSGFSGCHSTAHEPGSGCEDGSIVAEQTQRALHHGRQHWMSVKSRSSVPIPLFARCSSRLCVISSRKHHRMWRVQFHSWSRSCIRSAERIPVPHLPGLLGVYLPQQAELGTFALYTPIYTQNYSALYWVNSSVNPNVLVLAGVLWCLVSAGHR